MHIALRNRSNRPIFVDGVDVMPEVNWVLDHMRTFTHAIRSGEWKGYTGRSVTDVVNIGIGGSDLGPVMVTEALKAYRMQHPPYAFCLQCGRHPHRRSAAAARSGNDALCHCIQDLYDAGDPGERAIREGLVSAQQPGNAAAIARHFVALSTNMEEVVKFGIDTQNMFAFWDWVGGRYSLWSAIGLSIALSVGMRNFEELLAGAFGMDEHFRTAPSGGNTPGDSGAARHLVRQLLRSETHAILPYDQYLHRFPAYLQQAIWRATASGWTRDGETGRLRHGPVIWGEPGTNGQHAFFQLIHQGTRLIPADFIAPVETHNPVGIITSCCSPISLPSRRR